MEKIKIKEEEKIVKIAVDGLLITLNLTLYEA
jgi:hypothetical protein